MVGSEECEANGTAVEGCSNCMVQEGWECTEAVPTVCSPICGDGLVKTGETCDIGAIASPTKDDLEGCVKCQEQTGFDCDGSGCTPDCGDEHLVGSEECEASGTVVEGCSNCMVQEGWECSEAVPTVCSPICGDGLVKTG